jgi:hypothetical protein
VFQATAPEVAATTEPPIPALQRPAAWVTMVQLRVITEEGAAETTPMLGDGWGAGWDDTRGWGTTWPRMRHELVPAGDAALHGAAEHRERAGNAWAADFTRMQLERQVRRGPRGGLVWRVRQQRLSRGEA